MRILPDAAAHIKKLIYMHMYAYTVVSLISLEICDKNASRKSVRSEKEIHDEFFKYYTLAYIRDSKFCCDGEIPLLEVY